MDCDLDWCASCGQRMQPARRTIRIPITIHQHQLPPPPPRSTPHRAVPTAPKTGLINGTGRLRPKSAINPPRPPQLVIYEEVTPLYCSPECQQADVTGRSSCRRDELGAETETDTSSSSFASLSLPASPLPTPSLTSHYPLPCVDDDCTYSVPDYNTGIIMAGRLLSALCPSPPKPHIGRYPPPREEHKIVRGWNDGSNEWRKAIYSTGPAPKLERDPYGRESSTKAAGHPPHRISPTHILTTALHEATAVAAESRCASEYSLQKYSHLLARHSATRGGGGALTSPVSSSVSLSCSEIAVLNVKVNAHSDSPASISKPLTGSIPGPANNRRHACRQHIPLTAISDGKARPWSYDHVTTYPVLPMPIRKVKKMEMQAIDGKEVMVEIEVEEQPKRLFLFPHTRILP